MWKKQSPPPLNLLKTKVEKVNASTNIDQVGPNTWEKRKKKQRSSVLLYRVVENASKMQSPERHPDIMSDHLQKVVASSAAAGGDSTLVLWNGTEDAELGVQILVDVHDRSDVTASVAVVGRGPDRNHRLLGEVILRELVSWLRGKRENLLTL
jgi:hypothetical protein